MGGCASEWVDGGGRGNTSIVNKSFFLEESDF